MATDRHKILRRAHLNTAVDEAHQKLSDALAIDVPKRHPVRIRDKELLMIVNGEYQLEWFDDVVDAIKKLNKEKKTLKTQNTNLKKQLKQLSLKQGHDKKEVKADGEKPAAKTESGDGDKQGNASAEVKKSD
jgi:hypothetical protein